MDQVAALSDSVFYRWAALLEARTGVRVTPAWESHVRRVLGQQLQTLKGRRLACGQSVEPWWRELLESLLIRETRFYRHRPSFDYLARFMKAAARERPGQPVKMWSAGCSTGEEAYSMAITAQQCMPLSDFQVLASDLSQSALAQAREGVYPAARLSDLNLSEQACFEPLDTRRMRVIAPLRERLSWFPLNLVDRLWPEQTRDMDVIFCQHVLVYFGAEQRTALVERLGGCLKPGGRLVLGPGEAPSRPVKGLQRDRGAEALVFIRVGSGRES